MEDLPLLENKILEVDYCTPHQYGLRIYLSGKIMDGKPIGEWKKFDEAGNISEIIEAKDVTIYKTSKKRRSKKKT